MSDPFRVELNPKSGYVGKKFLYIFASIIFALNAIALSWYFFFSGLR